MNKNQLVVIAGLAAYVIGGAVVVISDPGAFIKIIRFNPGLFIPAFKTYGIILFAGIAAIYFLKDKRG